MKIGEFAKKNNAPIDTIRHYMELNLLLPIKSTHQYEFNEQCQQDYNEIVYLKSLQLSLKEIRTIIDYIRLTGISTEEYRFYIKKRLEMKKQDLISTLEKTRAAIDSIDKTLDDVTKFPPRSHLGIHLSLLTYLACPKCRKQTLTLESKAIENNMIFDGILTCTCGEILTIKDGILSVNGTPNLKNFVNISIEDYVEQTDLEILSNIRKGGGWIQSEVPDSVFEDALVLEVGTGSGFFIRTNHQYINKSHLYIAVDHDIKRHHKLKERLESAGLNCPIQFICCDYKAIPLTHHSVDTLVDFTGNSNIAFEEPLFLIDTINPLLKDTSHLLASYIIFEKFSLDHFLPLANRKFFIKQSILENLTHHHFAQIASFDGNFHTEGGPYENYFTSKDSVYMMWYYGKRTCIPI